MTFVLILFIVLTVITILLSAQPSLAAGHKRSRHLAPKADGSTTATIKAKSTKATKKSKNLVNPPLFFTGTSAQVYAACVAAGNVCCVNDSGGNACLNPGGDGMGIITVYPGSCKGDTACEDLPSGAVVYGTSCIGSYACDRLGEESTGKVEVGPNSCNGKNACAYLGYTAVGDVIVGASSCVGVDACYSLGDASLTNVIVGSGSCMGEEACFFLGDSGDALLTLTVGDGSCNGVDACNELGWDADYLTDITIQDRACLGVEACHYALFDFSFNSEDAQSHRQSLKQEAVLQIRHVLSV
jgi:hypothetical protein